MKNCISILKFSLCIFSLLLISLDCAHAQYPKGFSVVNKTTCTAHVTISCSDGTTASSTMAADDEWDSTCPVDEYICLIEVNLPGGGTSPEIISNNPVPCAISGSSTTAASSCYTQHIDWALVPTCCFTVNFY